MSGMCWIALELSISKIGFNIRLSLTVKKVDVSKFDGAAKSDNTALAFQRLPFSTYSVVPFTPKPSGATEECGTRHESLLKLT